jgi:excinuclease UvrABC nuclease subunit
MSMHERRSEWFPLVRRFELYAYATEADALVAEAEAISELKPDYNYAGNRGKLPPLARYLRRRVPQPPISYGPEIATDEISSDQLEIIARVQRRRPKTEAA